MFMENRLGWSVDCDRIRVCSQHSLLLLEHCCCSSTAAAQEVLLIK